MSFVAVRPILPAPLAMLTPAPLIVTESVSLMKISPLSVATSSALMSVRSGDPSDQIP